MALSTMLSRGSAQALRATSSRRGPALVRTMYVRAFKGEEESKGEQQTQQGSTAVEKQAPRTAPAHREDVMAVMPFRRMTDAMAQMQREMDAMLNTFAMADPFFEAPLARASPFALLDNLAQDLAPMRPARQQLSRLIPIEVSETEKEYTLNAEVPGFDKDDIKVTADPVTGTLTINAQHSEETKEEGEAKEGEAAKPTFKSIRRMAFTRTLNLPQDADLDSEWKAGVQNGVLSLTIPKAPAPEKPKPKEIPVA